MKHSERLYSVLLRLLPGDLRRSGRDEMLAVFRDGYREARRRGGLVGVARYWILTLYDLFLTRFSGRSSGRPSASSSSSATLSSAASAASSAPSPSTASTPTAHPPPAPRNGADMLGSLFSDLRHAARMLRRTPGFTAVALVTLALGIGANTAIFSVVDGVLLRPLPYEDPGELVALWADYTRREGPLREWLSYPNFHDARELDVFEDVALYGGWGPTLLPRAADAEPERLTGAMVTEGMFSRVLRVQPAVGRAFRPEEDVPDAEGVVLLSHGLWQRRFGSDPDAVGGSLAVDVGTFTIVGVMPAGFRPPFFPDADVWATPRMDMSDHPGGRASARFRAVGRLADGVGIEQARAALETLGGRLEREFPQANTGVGYALFPLHDDLTRVASDGLWALMAAVGLVLLIACVNVANLMLAQATSRRGELAVRTALGASRGRVVRQMLTESSVLAGLGGLGGVALGVYGTGLLVRLAPPGTPRIDSVQIDLRVLGFAVLASAGAALVFGLLPALRLSRRDLFAPLKEGGRGRDTGSGGRGMRSVLVVVQVALALVLLVGAGLFIRTFRNVVAVDPGFDTENLLTMNLFLPPERYDDGPARLAFFQELERRLAALPGVEGVGSTDTLPLSGSDGDTDFHIEGRPAPGPGEERATWVRRVTPSYMETIGLRIVAGRGFRAGDDAEAPRVVVINQTMAGRLFPDEDAVGKRLTFGGPDDPDWRRIVGVARDVKNFGLREGSRLVTYLPNAQLPSAFMFVAVRTVGEPTDLIPAVRGELAELDPLLAAAGFTPMSALVADALATERLIASLMTGFAIVALLLAVVGLYGVVSYGVGLRMHEMGVRVTLGARSGDILRLVVGHSLGLVGLGVVLGLAGAVALARLVRGLLFGVGPADPATLVSVTLLLTAVTTVAAMIPARRASGVDPAAVLDRE